MLKKSYQEFSKKFNNKIRSAKSTDPKTYWKLVNSQNNIEKTKADINLNAFYDYFTKQVLIIHQILKQKISI